MGPPYAGMVPGTAAMYGEAVTGPNSMDGEYEFPPGKEFGVQG